MTQHLETLKGILQRVLSDDSRNSDFKGALIHACNLQNIVSLEGWIYLWKELLTFALEGDEIPYQQGVQFVAEQWDRVVFEEKENEHHR